MKTSLIKPFKTLYTIALISFLLTAFTLVFTQVAGLILAQPTWIDWAENTLEYPSILCAIATGMIAFIVYNLEGKAKEE